MSELQIKRLGESPASAERPLRRAPARRHPTARRAAPPRRRRHAYGSEGRMWLAVLIALIIGVAGATWGARAASQASHSRAHIAALQAELASLQQRVAADERAAAGQARHLRSIAARAGGAQQSLQRINWALQSVPSQAQLADLRNALATYAACLPQLQREIDGLGLSWRIDAAKPASDSFKMFTSAPVSGGCAAALGGH